MNYYNFYTGKCFDAYEYMGAHTYWGGTTFRTYAPSAKKVTLIGEFSNWEEIPMNQVYNGHFWECSVDHANQGMLYKYRIYKQDGSFMDHADPYAFYSEIRPKTASIIWNRTNYEFQDHKWMRRQKPSYQMPLNIYELHLGSWKRPSDETENWYNYKEIAGLLIPYVKEMGYTHIELMPLAEYPCDESWGYQSTGYFSPTSRYGTPDDLRYFVDQCHQNQIGVILDFVPVHFAVNDYALWNYDGTALYEYPNSAVGYNEWGSCNFMHSRGEVCSFIQSSAAYWIKEFHFDGLRMDAVGNLIYWQGNVNRGENKNTIEFMQTMNGGLKNLFPHVLLFAEDSSAYKGVTKPISEGGLGFDYKWDLGWMNDTLSYFATPAEYRKDKYHKLTFSMMYFYDEHFVLPFSHDENVHGKATILNKMSGTYEEKFAQARTLYLYMFTHPGKKLNFMGNEIGQFREWDEKREQDWDIVKYPMHDAFQRFMKELHILYQNHPSLYQQDYEQNGFQWVDCHQEERGLYIYERRCEKERLLIALNLSNQKQTYDLKTDAKSMELLLDTSNDIYGGTTTVADKKMVSPQNIELEAFSGKLYLLNTL